MAWRRLTRSLGRFSRPPRGWAACSIAFLVHANSSSSNSTGSRLWTAADSFVAARVSADGTAPPRLRFSSAPAAVRKLQHEPAVRRQGGGAGERGAASTGLERHRDRARGDQEQRPHPDSFACDRGYQSVIARAGCGERRVLDVRRMGGFRRCQAFYSCRIVSAAARSRICVPLAGRERA